MDNRLNPISMLKPGRKIRGMSAVLLPFTAQGAIDWPSFRTQLERTLATGLVPAVNMDTGFAHLLDDTTKQRVLEECQRLVQGQEFLAGAFVADNPGASWNREAYLRSLDMIQHHGGTPIIFQSFGLTGQPDEALLRSYQELASACSSFYVFELGDQFAPFGCIYPLPLFEEIMKIPNCLGAKHSSLDRQLEWQRLQRRDEQRPDFLVLTGNDLAIDMVMYGSDYLLGLSTFAPEYFALRDRFWFEQDSRFYALNDLLQYLGALAFRHPVPAYKHSAAMFLKIRGVISSDRTHPASPERPETDKLILEEIWRSLQSYGELLD